MHNWIQCKWGTQFSGHLFCHSDSSNGHSNKSRVSSGLIAQCYTVHWYWLEFWSFQFVPQIFASCPPTASYVKSFSRSLLSVSSHFGNFVFGCFLATKLPKYYGFPILHDSLFIFQFVLPILPCKSKTSYRKSCSLSDEKPKTKLPKYMMSRVFEIFYLWSKMSLN